MSVDRILEDVKGELKKIPGIGEKTANRMIYHFLEQSPEEVSALARALATLKEKIRFCSACFNYATADLCAICQDPLRDRGTICVVSSPQDIMRIEETGVFNGLYHCLHGCITPLRGIGPDDIHVNELLQRLNSETKEVILALNSDYEGESTSFYIARLVAKKHVKVSRLATGLPLGSLIEYIDTTTLKNALDGRVMMY